MHTSHSEAILLKERLAALPTEWSDDLLPEIAGQVATSDRRIVVLDDDPTGTQTVHGIPVLTHWSVPALRAELEGPAAVFYLLTNSRSLTEPAAVALGREIGRNLAAAAKQAGVAIEVISRSDSTLRGHFPAEVAAVAEPLEQHRRPCLLVPFFLEGGRYTVDDVHYVAEGEHLVVQQAVSAPQIDTSGLELFPANTGDLKDCQREPPPLPLPDISDLRLLDIEEENPGN